MIIIITVDGSEILHQLRLVSTSRRIFFLVLDQLLFQLIWPKIGFRVFPFDVEYKTFLPEPFARTPLSFCCIPCDVFETIIFIISTTNYKYWCFIFLAQTHFRTIRFWWLIPTSYDRFQNHHQRMHLKLPVYHPYKPWIEAESTLIKPQVPQLMHHPPRKKIFDKNTWMFF